MTCRSSASYRSHLRQMQFFSWENQQHELFFHFFKHSFQLKQPCAGAAERRCYSIPLKWMKQWYATMQLTGIKTRGKMTDYRQNWVVHVGGWVRAFVFVLVPVCRKSFLGALHVSSYACKHVQNVFIPVGLLGYQILWSRKCWFCHKDDVEVSQIWTHLRL